MNEQDRCTAQSRRLQALFEHSAIALKFGLDYTRTTGDVFDDHFTNQLYCLWLAGRQQGVCDQATEQGLIKL